MAIKRPRIAAGKAAINPKSGGTKKQGKSSETTKGGKAATINRIRPICN